jgi:hypothetical protein
VATLGHGTIVELPSNASVEEVSSLLTALMGQSSHERWSRSRHVLEVGTGQRARKFTSSKGLLGIAGRTPLKRSYTPYQRLVATEATGSLIGRSGSRLAAPAQAGEIHERDQRSGLRRCFPTIKAPSCSRS